jgi:hypothetical protein
MTDESRPAAELEAETRAKEAPLRGTAVAAKDGIEQGR